MGNHTNKSMIMRKIILPILLLNVVHFSFGQQLTNGNFESWNSTSGVEEPNNWQYNDGTGLVYGTNNAFRLIDGVDPLTTTKVIGSAAYGGAGSSALLETKSAVGSYCTSNGYTTLPGYLYRQEAVSNPNIGAVTFNYKATVVAGDSCFVRIGLIDANFNIYSFGQYWIKPSNNGSTWQTKTIVLDNFLPGTPTEIFIEAMSTYDESYAYNTPKIGSKLYLDNFTLNYCSSITENITELVCANMLPYTWNGLVFNSEGTQSATLTSIYGCDSTVNMTLSVIPGPYTSIPDPAFEQALIDLGYDPCGTVDGFVPTSSINSVTGLTINNNYSNITNLNGLEDFEALQSLMVYGPNLQTNGINLTSNLQLKTLRIKAGLTSLDLSQNINLENLDFFLPSGVNNNISSLNLSTNVNLQNVVCSSAGIQNLVLPSTNTLTLLNCGYNNLNSINLSVVPNLQSLYASNNSLIDLGANNHTSLIQMTLNNNGFTGLNLSGFSSLESLDCSNNNLDCLNLKNGNNNQFTSVKTTNNFNLTCIEVDDSTFSTNNPVWNANKDSWSSYSEDCPGVCVTANTDEMSNNYVLAFPNPTSGQFSVESNQSIERLELIGLDGRTITSYKNTNLVDISNCQSGIYNLNIYFSNGQKSTQKIIKN
jgi:hypothetical protein